MTCILAGYDDQYPSVLADLRRLETDELDDNEKLLMAAAIVYSNPDEAIHRLEELSSSQKSPLKLVVLAEARIHQSYTSGNVQLCEVALQDLERVQFIVGRNLKNQVYRLFGTTCALLCAKHDNRTLDEQRLASEGAKVEEWLRVNHPESVSARHSRWFFLRAIGARKAAWEAIREVGKQGGTWCLFVAIDRALSGLDPATAVQEFDHYVSTAESDDRDNVYARVARLQMIAMLPNGREALEDGLKKLPSEMGLLPSVQALYLTCLLGNRERVCERALELLQQGESFEVLGTKDALECLAGEIDVAELLQRAGDSHVKQCAAHFAAGMLHLCDGKRDEAVGAFQRAVDTNGFTFFEHDLAQVYLKKLTGDPNWPYMQDK